MADSKTVEGGTSLASRPAVLPFLIEASVTPWGNWLEFRGGEAELIAAGIASPEMFENMGKSGQRKGCYSFGDDYTVKRRGRGNWDIILRLHDVVPDALPTDECPGKSPWWRKYCGETEAATAEILARFAKPKR